MNPLDEFMQALEPTKRKLPSVTQHNALIRAKFDYTLREIKTARLITSKANPLSDYEEGKGLLLEIHPDEAKAMYAEEGKSFKDLWGVFEKNILSLNSKPLQIDSDRITGHINFTSSAYKDKETGKFYVRTTPEITPFLVALNKGEFTTIPLQIYTHFKSKYLTRFYEQLYSNRSLRGGMKKYSNWTELARLCGWKGDKYSHFKNRVLREGQDRFPSFTPVTFEFEEIKKPGTKSVEGLVFTITTQKPKKQADPELFPEMMENQSTIEEIRNQLVSWSVNHLTIERLIENPFQYIQDEVLKKKLQQNIDKLDYLWEKMEYVAHAKNAKDEAKYLMMAIKNNYINKSQTTKKETIKKKVVHKQRQADLASIENAINIVRKETANLRSDIVSSILTNDADLMKEIFESAAKKYNHNESLEELKTRFHKKGMFRYRVISQVMERFPEQFETINKSEETQIQTFEKQKLDVKNREN